MLWLLGGLFVTRGVGVAHSVVTERQRVQQHMTAALFEKMLHSQEGVLSVILEVRAGAWVGHALHPAHCSMHVMVYMGERL